MAEQQKVVMIIAKIINEKKAVSLTLVFKHCIAITS